MPLVGGVLRRLPSVPSPTAVPRAIVRLPGAGVAPVRRAGVRTLMAASKVPGLRTVAEAGMRGLFDELAPSWEKIREDPAYRRGFVEALERLPRGFAPRRVLDASCGTGMAAQMVLERWPGVRVIGADVSPRMVEIAREQVPGARFDVASIHRLPYVDGEFDLVVSLDGIVDPAQMLRVVGRKGRVLVVYSKGGTTPISRPVGEVVAAFERVGGIATAPAGGEAAVVVARHGR